MNRSRSSPSGAGPSGAGPTGTRAPPGAVRIIGGRWRGTRLPVPERQGLRPTSDRVRETLFNWLQPVLAGARVLDVFAGSGALGLEALSRGAHAATLIERDRDCAENMRQVLAKLRAGNPADDIRADVVCADALSWLATSPESRPGFDLAGLDAARFDLVFLDPPFDNDADGDGGLWRRVLELLPAHLAEDAWLYLESPGTSGVTPGEGWRSHREGRTREVHYALYRRI